MNSQFSNFLNRNFIFCDVGARWGLEEPWRSNRDYIDVISFEPDQEEYLQLKKNKLDRDIVLPYALFQEEKKVNLNLTKSRGCSSVYLPNFSYLERYPDIERFTIEKKEMLESTTLDSLYDKKFIENLDFVKLDTQGAELDILKAGEKLLDENIVGIQVEVYFKPIYDSQPLFSDVDALIRNNWGLELIDIKKVFWKYNEENDIGPKKGQLIFGDALYFRDPHKFTNWCEQFEDKEAKNKIVMACFMGVLYGCPNYSLYLLGRPELIQWMKEETIDELKAIIFKIAKCKNFSFRGCGRLWKFLHLLSKMFDPEPFKWATGDRHLGSRKEFGIYY